VRHPRLHPSSVLKAATLSPQQPVAYVETVDSELPWWRRFAAAFAMHAIIATGVGRRAIIVTALSQLTRDTPTCDGML
jgi:hypothetical protein